MSVDGSSSRDDGETRAVRERYARRAAIDPGRYSLANPAALLAMQERQRAMLRLFADAGLSDFGSLRMLEVGSGAGDNLLELIRLGFDPAKLEGIELLEARHAVARERLPVATKLSCADAVAALDGVEARFDVVYQSTVFSSLLDDAFQQRLAAAMWRAAKPGGGVLWYDFTVDNPRNRDVRGVSPSRVRALFPGASHVTMRRVTLAPPLARGLARLHPLAHAAAASIPWLRTHRLAWLAKPAG